VKHYPALALAMMPTLAYLITVPLNAALGPGRDPVEGGLMTVQTLRCLANGFLISGMLWAAALAMILDGRLKAAAGYWLAAGVCAFFGIIHSPLPSEQIGLPWHVLGEVPSAFGEVVRYQTPYHWTATYGLLAVLTLALGLHDGTGRQYMVGESETGTGRAAEADMT
jgi:AGZA family xanthine/uracil permease-like MFS transporter